MYGTFADFFRVVQIALIVSIPLAIWKLVDIVIWIVHHVRVSVG